MPSDGVPSASVTKSMYQPDGTRARFSGTVTVMPSGDFFRSSAIDRWSVSVTWVTALGRISFAEVIDGACRVVNVPVPPREMRFGPAVSSGRPSRYRYGGV